MQIICATLLTAEEVTVNNIPDILDVNNLIQLLREMGVTVAKKGIDSYSFKAENVDLAYLESDEFLKKCSSLRGSVMLIGPMVARFGKALISKPGGDKIGRRRLDTHFVGIQNLGADFRYDEERGIYEITADRLQGSYMLLDEASVTGTANIVMAAVLAKGTTTIYNAACEPYVQQLCRLLNRMGAKISGIASNLLTIEGVEELHGTQHTVLPDMIEVGSFIGMAAMTRSEITIKNTGYDHLGIIPDVFRKLGIAVERRGDDIHIPAQDHYTIEPFLDGISHMREISRDPTDDRTMGFQFKKPERAGRIIFELEQGRITGIFPYGEKQADVDYGSKRIVPGFMDIHCHGAYEFDTNDAKPEGLRYWAKHIVSEGVTSFLATTVTQSVEVLTNAVANVADVMEGSYEGAEILGIHFEGPYLDMKYKGAQPPEYIAKPSVEQFKHYQQAARGHIRYVTLAPEHDEGFALTHYLTEHGVVVSIGHSAATYEQAVMAYANGARSMTHVYNGMSPFAHRANGLVGAAYRIRTMYGEIICDGCHSTPAALNNYFMSKGPDYAIMISDALMAKGTPIGSEYIFGGNHITIYPDGSAHLDNGTLAGSTLNINKGLRILVEEAMVPFNYALNACTINPARCLHLDDRKGSIQIGKDADLVVLDDNYDVLQTYCMGQPKL